MRRGEGHPVAPPRGLHREGDGQVRLAGPGRAEEDDVDRLGEEVELGEVRDDLPLDARLDREVEVVDGLDGREAGRLHPGRAAVAVAGGHLLGEDRREIRLVVPALRAGLLGEPAGDVPDARCLERARQIGQLGGGAPGHAGTSQRRS